MEACWAHNPEVRGSQPRSANFFKVIFSHVYSIVIAFLSRIKHLSSKYSFIKAQYIWENNSYWIIQRYNKRLHLAPAISRGFCCLFVTLQSYYYEWTDTSVGYPSRVAQWKRAGPITQRSEDRNLALLSFLLVDHLWLLLYRGYYSPWMQLLSLKLSSYSYIFSLWIISQIIHHMHGNTRY